MQTCRLERKQPHSKGGEYVVVCCGPWRPGPDLILRSPKLQLIGRTQDANGLRVASLIDLAGMKAAVVQKRAEAKDYLDIDAIIHQGGVSLPTALSAAKKLYGAAFNPALTLKALCYFGDGNLASLSHEVQQRLLECVRSVNLDQLPHIEAFQN